MIFPGDRCYNWPTIWGLIMTDDVAYILLPCVQVLISVSPLILRSNHLVMFLFVLRVPGIVRPCSWYNVDYLLGLVFIVHTGCSTSFVLTQKGLDVHLGRTTPQDLGSRLSLVSGDRVGRLLPLSCLWDNWVTQFLGLVNIFIVSVPYRPILPY